MGQQFEDKPQAFVQYVDATYKYFCEADAGTAVDAAKWRVSRMVIATTQIQWSTKGNYDNLATDLAAVQALSYA